jgi:UDP-N-acetylglucosamine--N-acetylmuramyl-(pentapeptide) pyrophosphoryl-undecaprenol N-acetylglucosamine transferase
MIQPTKIRILFAAGGTGGHIYPCIALAQTIRDSYPNSEILFIGGDRAEIEKIPAAGFKLKSISVHGVVNKLSIKTFPKKIKSLFELISGIPVWQSISVLRDFKPHVVIGASGYVCGPVLLAAKMLGIPGLLLEQNEEIGVTSKIVASLHLISTAVVISEKSGDFFKNKGITTINAGNPVRPAILKTTREMGYSALKLDNNRKTLSIVGGSLGSLAINNASIYAIRELGKYTWFRDGWQVVHITGSDRGGGLSQSDADHLGIKYFHFKYIDAIENLLAVSDMMVTRAGGTFLAEISACGIPMIIIPWSGAAGDHQSKNSQIFADKGAAIIIPDDDLNGESLHLQLSNLCQSEKLLINMGIESRKLGRPESSQELMKIIINLAMKGK